jgi:hypothetical protein
MPKGTTSRPKNKTMKKMESISKGSSSNLDRMAEKNRKEGARKGAISSAKRRGAMLGRLGAKEAERQGRQKAKRKN